MGEATEPKDSQTPPPLFSKREKHAIALLTASFIVLSAFVHLVIGSIGGSLLPHFRKEAAAPPQIVDVVRLVTPTPTPMPTPTPKPPTTTPRPSPQRTNAPQISPPRPPRHQSGGKQIATSTAPPHVIGPVGPPTAAPQASPLPTTTPAAPATPSIAVDADFLRKSVPDYPDLAQQEHVEGKVTVRVTIGPDGSVENVALVESSGSKLLDDAALQAARSSTFRPPLENGVPTTRDYLIIYTFCLDDCEGSPA